MTNQSTKSDFNVEVVRITNVLPHPNADRLEQYETTAGYPILDTKGKYKVGDLAVYVPVDAVVPLSNPAFSFLRSKPEQETARIGARRLRGIYSEGLLVSISTLPGLGYHSIADDYPVGIQVGETLGITRYVSPNELREGEPSGRVAGVRKARAVSGMPVYGLDSLLRFKDAIPIGTPVVITEKIHGCNARYMFKDGRLYVGSHKVMRGDSGDPFTTWVKNTWRELKHRISGVFRANTRGGNLSAIQEKGDIWWQIAEQYDLKTKLSQYPGLTFYGEIYGKGLQVRGGVDFCYDAPEGLKFRVFDIWDASKGEFLDYVTMQRICLNLGLETSPELACGPWPGLDKVPSLDNMKDPLLVVHIREGWVVRTDVSEADPNRKTFKWVSPEYKLLGEPSAEKKGAGK